MKIRSLFDIFHQAPLRERFARVPYIQFSKGDDFGLVGFEKALKEDEIEYVKESLKTVNSKEVVWTIPDGTCFIDPHPRDSRLNLCC